METLNKEFWEKRDAAMIIAAEPVRKQNHFVCCNV